MNKNRNLIRKISQRTIPRKDTFRHSFKDLFNTIFNSSTQSEENHSKTNNKSSTKSKTKIDTEKKGESYYRDKLARKLNGKIEISTPVGRIDILTSTEIIEVKSVKGWKQAMGQIIAYGEYYPDRHKRIHLFGEIPNNSSTIEKCCLRQNIVVSWEDDET